MPRTDLETSPGESLPSTGGAWDAHSGGDGGRIGIRASGGSTFPSANLSVRGGDGNYGDGQDGTIFLTP